MFKNSILENVSRMLSQMTLFFSGLLVFFALGGTFYYANLKLVQFIHQTAVRVRNGVDFSINQ